MDALTRFSTPRPNGAHPAPQPDPAPPSRGLPFPSALENAPPLIPFLLIGFFALAMALLNWLQGRWLICDCGYVELWAGKGHPDGTSQHIADWYTPSHLLHGFVFYALFWLILPRWSFAWRLCLAALVEAIWEVVENMSFIIDRYRQVTISKDYNGDTIINSLADIGIMLVGFALARRLPVKLSLAVVIGFELLTLWIIRDGLALNILMLLWPIPELAAWQGKA